MRAAEAVQHLADDGLPDAQFPHQRHSVNIIRIPQPAPEGCDGPYVSAAALQELAHPVAREAVYPPFVDARDGVKQHEPDAVVGRLTGRRNRAARPAGLVRVCQQVRCRFIFIELPPDKEVVTGIDAVQPQGVRHQHALAFHHPVAERLFKLRDQQPQVISDCRLPGGAGAVDHRPLPEHGVHIKVGGDPQVIDIENVVDVLDDGKAVLHGRHLRIHRPEAPVMEVRKLRLQAQLRPVPRHARPDGAEVRQFPRVKVQVKVCHFTALRWPWAPLTGSG